MQHSLNFALDVVDGWPPAGSECLPFEPTEQGYRLLSPPLFLKDLSVGDVIACKVDEASGLVSEWAHVEQSEHTTITMLRMGGLRVLDAGLEKLRALGCSTTSVDELGICSVDVPATVSMDDVDDVLDELEEAEVPIAFPSMRHPE